MKVNLNLIVFVSFYEKIPEKSEETQIRNRFPPERIKKHPRGCHFLLVPTAGLEPATY